MPDFRSLVRTNIAALHLPPHRELKVVDEYAAQIEDVYAALLEEGLSADAAWKELPRRIPSWPDLRAELLVADPVVQALSHAPFPRRPDQRTALGVALGRVWDGAVDLRRSMRRLWRDRAFSATAVVTLAVCLGANAAIFTIVNRVLLNPMTVPDPSRIMLMANQFPKMGAGGTSETSAPRNYYDRRGAISAFSEQAMFAPVDRVVTASAGPTQLHGLIATPSLFRVLGVPAAQGRTFTDEEGDVGHDDRVVLSDELWRELYARAPSAIGGQLRVNGRPFTIVGVMPARFTFFDPAVRFWIPLAFTRSEQTNPIANNWYNVGRLAPGATRELAQTQLNAVNAAFLDTLPRLRDVYQAAGYHTTIDPLGDVLVRGVRRTLYLLWGGAAIVLLVGTINIANLTLARARLRARDLTTRMALGASRMRLAATLLVESLAMALAAGGFGVLLGIAMLKALSLLQLEGALPPGDVAIGAATGVFVLGAALVAGALISLASISTLGDLALGEALRQGSRTTSGDKRATAFRRVVVVAQVAMTFVLLAGAGLFMVTVRNLLAVNPGFSTDHVVTAAVTVPRERYPDIAATRRLFDRVMPAFQGVPSVTSVAATTVMPLAGSSAPQAVIAEEHQPTPGESIITPAWVGVTPGFFVTMGTSLSSGRDFDSHDIDSDAGVVIVDRTLARRLWDADDVLGKRLFLPGVRNILQVTEKTRWLTVVGVVPDVRLERLVDRAESVGTFYTPYSEGNANNPPRRYGFVVKTQTDPVRVVSDLRRVLAGVDPELALFDVLTMTERVTFSVARERLALFLAAAFGVTSLLLAALGVYGVLSYLVSQRSRELGIRLALGSTAAGVFTLVLREGAVLVVAGLVAGVTGAYLLQSVFANVVHGARLDDPILLLTVTMLVVVVGAAACIRPARRATRIDPISVLRDALDS